MTILRTFSLAALIAATFMVRSPGPVAAATTFVVNKIGDAVDLNPGNGICDSSTKTGKQCTLRAAIQEANALAGKDTINFNIRSVSKVIAPATPLPPITQAVTINGYSQSGASANTKAVGNDAQLKIILDGVNAGSDADGLVISAANSVIKGLDIQRFGNDGILLDGSDNRVQGNFIGTNVDASAAAANRIGIEVKGPNNQIGGTAPAARNVISGNSDDGVLVITGGATGTHIQGSYIGTNRTGTSALGNSNGVRLVLGGSNLIGGETAGAGNVISGNASDGILSNAISISSSSGNVIQGNRIGTNAAGDAALPNGRGISGGGDNTTIGGLTTAARNVISGNDHEGIDLCCGSGTVIQGNYIGRNAAGNADIGNSTDGVVVLTGGTTVGGDVGAAANLVSGNVGNGVRLIAGGNVVKGNVIEANGGAGVITLLNLAHPELNGSNTIGPGNVIFGNDDHGIDVVSPPTGAHNTGQRITSNQIFGNGGLGINLRGGTENSFLVTSNDTDDPDDGSNNLQNFPVITSAHRSSSTGLTTIAGSLNSNPSTDFTIEFFLVDPDPSGHGEGQLFLGSRSITTDSGGDKAFSFVTAQLAPGQAVTATATATAAGDTSEFAANMTVLSVP
jgi:CSLREA domain-containing protein